MSNRLADLCGALRTGWGWLGALLQVGIIVGVGWAMFEEGAKNAAGMWLVLGVAVFFWVASVAFSLICLVLIGRYPGEAKAARKSLSGVIEQCHAAEAGRAPDAYANDSNY